MLTKRQNEILFFLNKFQKKHGFAPSLEDIRRNFKLSSVSTAHFHISRLKAAGYLSKTPNQPRAIEIKRNIEMIKVPLLGTVAAGLPIEAIQSTETVSVPRDQVPQTGNLFALTVSGNSMIDEGIQDGDTILLRQQSTAENGDKVVALLNNEGATLKTFSKKKGVIQLIPANRNYTPITLSKTDTIDIQGVLVGVLKSTDQITPNSDVLLKHDKQIVESKLPLDEIICGDVIEEMRRLPSESFDAIVIDPPYNIGKDFGNDSDKREMAEYIAWSKEWIRESERLVKPGGTIFVYGFSEILAFLSVEISLPKRWLIWHYTNKNVASAKFWQRSHESIVCAWKGVPVFNRDAVREPYTESFLNNAAGKVRTGTPGRFSRGGKETVYNAHEGGALPRDVIKIPALAGGAGRAERWFLCRTCDDVFPPSETANHAGHDVMKHPTQKPLELTKRLLTSCLPPDNATVLVPFAGSGSECVAAKALGASFVGIELNPEYVRLGNGFLSDFKRD